MSDFYGLMIYECIEPFGDRRRDIQLGQICATIVNVNRTKSTDKISQWKDFIPKWDAEPIREQTVEQQVDMMILIATAQNAIEENKRRLSS